MHWYTQWNRKVYQREEILYLVRHSFSYSKNSSILLPATQILFTDPDPIWLMQKRLIFLEERELVVICFKVFISCTVNSPPLSTIKRFRDWITSSFSIFFLDEKVVETIGFTSKSDYSLSVYNLKHEGYLCRRFLAKVIISTNSYFTFFASPDGACATVYDISFPFEVPTNKSTLSPSSTFPVVKEKNVGRNPHQMIYIIIQ